MAWETWATPPEALPAPVVDNHCHLDSLAALPEGRGPERILADAAAAGVTRVVNIGCDIASAHWTARAVQEHPTMVGGVALHPNEVAAHADGTHASGLNYEDAFAQIASLARGERIRVVGETGLDYFWSQGHKPAIQERAFRDHLALAREVGKPLQIHDREAHADVLRVVDSDGAPPAVIMHCFSGDADLARECLARGWYLSFAGTVTFRNAPGLREAAALCPADRLLVETDSPYLAPHPQRGTINSPAMVATTMRTLAEVRGEDLALLCERVNTTSEALFGPW